MSTHASNEYFRNAVLTAKPEQLQLMLYDGAIRFARQAREALMRKDLEASCDKIIRVQRIVAEMQNGLRPAINPTLCGQLASLYGFIYDRLLTANMKQDLGALDEAIQILEHQRGTWQLLVEKLGTLQSGPAETSPEGADVHEALSVQG